MLKQPINQVVLTNVSIVKLKKKKKNFEVACYKNKILNWRSGIEKDIDNVLQSHYIYESVKKGKFAKIEDIFSYFDTDNVKIALRCILNNGIIQVAEKERQDIIDFFFREVSSLVSEKVYNAKTFFPFPSTCISQMLKKSGFSINMNTSVKQLASKAIKVLCKNYPSIVEQYYMKIGIVVQSTEIEEVNNYMKNHFDIQLGDDFSSIVNNCSSINNKSDIISKTSNEDIKDNLIYDHYNVAIECLPCEYRNVELFVSNHLSEKSYTYIISQKVTKPVIPTSKSCSYSEIDCSSDSKNIPSLDCCTKPNREVTSCITCFNLVFETVDKYREHCKTESHISNIRKEMEKLL